MITIQKDMLKYKLCKHLLTLGLALAVVLLEFLTVRGCDNLLQSSNL
uniref:Uncharacterized protein n=1 Tax=Phakopsora pachyrhizi TaxID=170000 RepID=A0A0S1MIQ8_PHAPC